MVIWKKFTRKFENFISKYCNRKHSLAFSNATSAMIVGMKALGIKNGDEVIVPSFSHSADANSISATGATNICWGVNNKYVSYFRSNQKKNI